MAVPCRHGTTTVREWTTLAIAQGRPRMLDSLQRFPMRGFVLSLLSGIAVFGQVPEIPFKYVPDLLKLPRDMNLGETSGVAVNSKGHIFVFTRSNSATGPAYGAAAAQLFEFDADGKFLREVAKNLYAWSFA